MDPDMRAEDIRVLYNGFNSKVEEFKGMIAKMVSEIQKLKEEKKDLSFEVEVLQSEISSLNYFVDENNNLRLKLVKVPIGPLMAVDMAFNTSPSDLWLHINSREVDDFHHLIQVKQTELKDQPNCDLTAADVELGMYCAAIYSSDGYWYRAQVIDITYDHPIERDSIKSVLVLFIDWGNSEERPLSSLMKLSLELSKRKQAINCYVQGSAHRMLSKWPDHIIKEYASLLKNKRLKAIFNRPHKVDHFLYSVVYPIDLMFESEDGSYVNLNEVLSFLELEDELNQTIKMNGELECPPVAQKEAQSADAVVCNGVLNGHSNPNLTEFIRD